MPALDAYRAKIYALVNTVWAVDQIFAAENVQRLNWRDLVERWEQGETELIIEPPWSVVEWMEPRAYEGGPCNEFNHVYPVALWIATTLRDKTTGESRTVDQVQQELDTAAEAMMTALLVHTPEFLVLGLRPDTSSTLSANAFFLANNLPFQAAAVFADLLPTA